MVQGVTGLDESPQLFHATILPDGVSPASIPAIRDTNLFCSALSL